MDRTDTGGDQAPEAIGAGDNPDLLTLDKTRPYAVVVGNDPKINHTYEQDGKIFDAQGVEIIPVDAPRRRRGRRPKDGLE